MAALLFKIQACTQLDLNKVAFTSKLCAWKKSRKRAHPAPLKEMCFKRPKEDDMVPKVASPFKGTLSGYSTPDPIKFLTQHDKKRLDLLRKIAPKAGDLIY